MEKIIYFDYSAAAVLILLAISVYIRRLTRGRLNRFYIGLLCMILVTVVADIYAISFDNAGAGNIGGKTFSHTLYLLLHTLMPAAYVFYLIALADSFHFIIKKKWPLVILIVPYVIEFTLCHINVWNGCVFYFDENDTYTRGPLFSVLYLCTIVYVLYGTVFLLKYRKLFSKERFNGLISMYPLMLLAALFQALVPTMPVEMFANALSLVFISMVVQKPEELIDANTNLLKKDTYYSDLEKAFATGKNINIVMFNILNHDTLFDMLSIEGVNSVKKQIADRMQTLNDNNSFKAEIYYIEHGKYRFVLSADFKKKTDPMLVAEALRNAFVNGIDYNGFEVGIQIALSIVRVPQDADDVETIKSFSDDLYHHVTNGMITRAWEVACQDRFEVIRHIDSIIEKAFVNKAFEVYYQPIYSVKEHRFNSAEALLRLKDDKYGFVSPEIFIPAAERNGSIHKIGSFVLNEVCNFIASKEYEETGLDYIEVNLSVTQCMRPDMADEIQEVMQKYDIKANSINLEITETATSFEQSTLHDNLSKLTDRGITFSLDDFGTGYSNMQRIASLPLHIVKLDKIFTKLDDNKNMEHILKNSVNMIKDMEMKIVIEGIETEDKLKYFSDLGCDYIQGYYFSKPIPRNEFVAFLTHS